VLSATQLQGELVVQEYTASLVNTARFILDKAVDPYKSDSKNTGDI
jgi:hypothetical protein